MTKTEIKDMTISKKKFEDVSELLNNKEYIPEDSRINLKLFNKSCEVEQTDKLDKKKKI